MEVESEITEWYRGKAVFITGATGFMGKVLVEKLLRSCPGVGPIYVLVREKKNMSSQDRINQIMTSSVFDEVNAIKTDRKDWIFPVPGDVGLPNLGISAEDRRLLQDKVSVVFHLAATVRFDEPLRVAVAINLKGTQALMQLCLGMTNLSAIVHVSTAYANCNLSTIEERIYPPPAEPDKIMHCVAGMDDDLLETIAPRLIGNYQNTYIFTKALAEHLVAGYATELPIVVVRPSIVTASWREPTPGWVDGYNGPTGLLVGAGKGLLKTVYGKGELVADMIPVDVCVNLFITAAWEIGIREVTKLGSDVRVYNCVSRPFKSISWNPFVKTISSCTRKFAMSDVFMSPNLEFTDKRVMYMVTCILQQTLPAILGDILIRLSGGTPRLRHYQSKVIKHAALADFFTTHEFEFKADNVEELKRRLNPADRVIFNFDLTNIDWEEYTNNYFLGIRRYLMKENDDTIPAARKQVAKWIFMKRTVQIAVFVIALTGYSQIYASSSL